MDEKKGNLASTTTDPEMDIGECSSEGEDEGEGDDEEEDDEEMDDDMGSDDDDESEGDIADEEEDVVDEALSVASLTSNGSNIQSTASTSVYGPSSGKFRMSLIPQRLVKQEYVELFFCLLLTGFRETHYPSCEDSSSQKVPEDNVKNNATEIVNVLQPAIVETPIKKLAVKLKRCKR